MCSKRINYEGCQTSVGLLCFVAFAAFEAGICRVMTMWVRVKSFLALETMQNLPEGQSHNLCDRNKFTGMPAKLNGPCHTKEDQCQAKCRFLFVQSLLLVLVCAK